MVRFSFIPQEEKFSDLFEKSARNVVMGARRFKELVHEWDRVGETVREITDFEHEGDRITHEIMRQVHRSFITPFDREDIALLTHSLDDIIDFIEAAADAMVIYNVDEPAQTAKKLSDVILQQADEVEKAILKLRHRSRLNTMLENCVEINRLENVADDIYRTALGELFNDGMDIPRIIQWREIYEYMESATDRGEDVANVLEGIALKQA